MASLIDYEGLTCECCGAEGSLVPDGDFDVECTSCGVTYSLEDDYEDEYDEDECDEDDICSEDFFDAEELEFMSADDGADEEGDESFLDETYNKADFLSE